MKRLNDRQSNYGLYLMDSSESIATGFSWYNFNGNDKKYWWKPSDLKRLKKLKKRVDRDYIRFVCSL